MSSANASPASEGHPDDCQLPLSDCAVCQENEFARLGGCVQQINQSITDLQEQAAPVKLTAIQLAAPPQHDPRYLEAVNTAYQELIMELNAPGTATDLSDHCRAAFKLAVQDPTQSRAVKIARLYAERRAIEKMERALLQLSGYRDTQHMG